MDRDPPYAISQENFTTTIERLLTVGDDERERETRERQRDGRARKGCL